MNNNNYDNIKDEVNTNTETPRFIKDLKVSELPEKSKLVIDQEHYRIGKPTRKTIRAKIIHD
ncbi:MAG: hypothetical protein KAV97_05630 [Actinomycetia bacterium]|nr:hypothetical protein [Actinomycetes bacterium]